MLTLRDALLLPSLNEFRLIAGKRGLEQVVREVNILDFEYTGAMQEPFEPDGLFHSGAMVLASLLFAKDDPDLILPALKQLRVDGCCAVAVKTVYYKEIPPEVIQYADANDMPLFLFEKTDFENVIYEVFKAVYQESRINNEEKNINKILEDQFITEEKMNLVKELVPQIQPPFRCDYYRPKKTVDLLSYEQLMNHLWKRNQRGNYCFPYKNGILQLSECKHRHTIAEELLCAVEYCHGIGEEHTKYEEIPYALMEGITAVKYAELFGHKTVLFSQMGIMQMLLPNKSNYWVQRFCERIIDTLMNAEGGKNTELFHTIQIYVEENFDVAAAADALAFHKNTVRYRIQKAKELLGYDENTAGFNQTVYLAMTYSKLK